MTITRSSTTRWLSTAVAAAVALAGLAACGSDSGSSGASITVGYLANVQAGGLLGIAQKQDLWSKYHLKVKTVPFTDGPTEVQAMEGGQIDVAFVGPGALWLPAGGQADIIAIDSLTTSGDALIAKKSVTSLAGIKGLKVGYAKGTSGQMLLDLALAKAGLTEGDVKLVPLPYPQVTTAYLSGQVDVALPNIAGRQAIVTKDKDSHVLSTDSDYAPRVQFPQAWVTSDQFRKSHRSTLVDFDEVFAAANDYRATHLDQTVSLAASFTKTPLAQQQLQASGTKFLPTATIAQDLSGGDVAKWMGPLQDLFISSGLLKQKADPSTFVDTSILSDAMKATG